jgi:hypothetical protein
MSEMQSAEVRFEGEKLATYTDGSDVYSLYRTTEGLYRIHVDESEGKQAWLESARSGNGLTAAQVRTVFPELSTSTIRPGSWSPQGPRFPMSGDAGA